MTGEGTGRWLEAANAPRAGLGPPVGDGADGALDLLAVGGLTWDAVVRPHGARLLRVAGEQLIAFPHGAKVHLDEATFGPGGGAANVSVVAGRLGLRTGIVACVGTDATAASVLEHLRREGVDTTRVRQHASAHTGVSVVLAAPDGDRTILVHAGANADLGSTDVDPARLPPTRWLYVSSLRGSADRLFDALATWAPTAGVRLALNPGATQVARGTAGLRSALRACDVLLVNDDEARALLGGAPAGAPWDLARRLHESVDGGVVVVTCGPAGSETCGPDGERITVPAVPGPIACTLGAGDAFGATVVARLAQGRALRDALQAAAVNATAVVGRHGAHDGALTADDLAAALDRTVAAVTPQGAWPATL